MIHCEGDCGIVPVPEKDLPVLLPTEGIAFSGRGGSPLVSLESWLKCSCPKYVYYHLQFKTKSSLLAFAGVEDQPNEKPIRWILLSIRPGISCAILMLKMPHSTYCQLLD